MSTALSVVIALGCSEVRKLSAWHALSNHVGTLFTVVTPRKGEYASVTVLMTKMAWTYFGPLGLVAAQQVQVAVGVVVVVPV